MERETKLVKNTAILAIGSFFPKVTSLITLPILTAMLSKSEYGTYDLVGVLVSLLLPVATLQIQSAAFRFLIESKDLQKRCNEIVTNIFIVTIPISIVMVGIVFFVFSKLTLSSRIFICLYFLFDIIELTLLQIARGFSENKAYSIASIMLSSVNMILTVVLVLWLKNGLAGVMCSLAMASIVATVYLIVVLKKHVKVSLQYLSVPLIKEMLAYSWPMVFNNLSRWALSTSDRLVITAFMGVEANAIYAVATKLPNLLSTLQSTFSMAWQENASIAAKDDDSSQYYSNMFDTFFCFLSGMLAILIAGTPILFTILIRGDYDEAYVQMPILYMGMLFDGMAAFLGGIYVARKKTKSIGITTVIAAGINLAIDLAFVNSIGIFAGSISTLVSYLFLMIYRMVDIRKIQKIDYKIGKIFVILAVMTLMSFLCWLQNPIANIFNAAIGIVVLVAPNKTMIMSMWNVMLKKAKIK